MTKPPSVRSTLYRAARFLGNIHALTTGRIVQRLVRSRIHAKIGALINRAIK